MKLLPSIPGISPSNHAILQAALLFFIISHPMTYKLVNSILGPILGYTSTPSGCPTTLGLIVHSAAFGAVYKHVL